MSDSLGLYQFSLSGWKPVDLCTGITCCFFSGYGRGLTHLVHVKDEVQLTDVLEALIQRLHEHLK